MLGDKIIDSMGDASPEDAERALNDHLPEWGMINPNKFQADGLLRKSIPNGELQNVKSYIRDMLRRIGMQQGDNMLTIAVLMPMGFFMGLIGLCVANNPVAKLFFAAIGLTVVVIGLVLAINSSRRSQRKFVDEASISYYEFKITQVLHLSVRVKVRAGYIARVEHYAKFGKNMALLGYDDYDETKYKTGETIGCIIVQDNKRTFFVLTRPIRE